MPSHVCALYVCVLSMYLKFPSASFLKGHVSLKIGLTFVIPNNLQPKILNLIISTKILFPSKITFIGFRDEDLMMVLYGRYSGYYYKW